VDALLSGFWKKTEDWPLGVNSSAVAHLSLEDPLEGQSWEGHLPM